MSGLSEQECEAFFEHTDPSNSDASPQALIEHVERIVAAREAQVAERIAQAIEDAAVAADVDMIEVHGAFVRRAPYASEHLRDAARIAREIGGQS